METGNVPRMELANRVCVVTGGASGIGRAGAIRFAHEGAKVGVADRDVAGAMATVEEIVRRGGEAIAIGCDVSKEADIIDLIEQTEARYGDIDLFWSNAGIGYAGGEETADSEWQNIWEINVMSHVWAARHLVPKMIERKHGYLLSTASAAGLLSNIGTASYTVTKHAAVAFAEWLSITHGDNGLLVSCLCPQGVNTNMLNPPTPVGSPGNMSGASTDVVKASGPVLEPEDVADAVVIGLRAEQFLILPHPEVLSYWQRKSGDIDRWLGAMRRLQAKVRSSRTSSTSNQ
jgi:NAD(P)-dependent dehydrogenase (short-subunit alcohol dehydrogenase family)